MSATSGRCPSTSWPYCIAKKTASDPDTTSAFGGGSPSARSATSPARYACGRNEAAASPDATAATVVTTASRAPAGGPHGRVRDKAPIGAAEKRSASAGSK